MSTTTTTTVHVDCSDAVGLEVPTAAEEAFSRPVLRVGGGVYVNLLRHGDAGAAAWLRGLAATAELAARWYDARGGAR